MSRLFSFSCLVDKNRLILEAAKKQKTCLFSVSVQWNKFGQTKTFWDQLMTKKKANYFSLHSFLQDRQIK